MDYKGNKIISLIFFKPHSNIHNLSIPQPHPAVGGIP
jgi:hypothetical protein